MRFSIWPGLTQPWNDVASVAAHAEATGWDGLYVADHFMGDAGGFGPTETPTFEATAAIAALAASTTRLRLGSLVLSATYRHPAVLAKWAATVDHISGGRLLLGIGAGWQINEHEQYGLALGPPAERVARFDEYVRGLVGLLNEPTTNVDGSFYKLTEAIAEPKPVQATLPLLIGASGPKMLRIVARHAQAWNTWGLPDAIATTAAVLDRACELEQRDPLTIERSAQALVFLTDDAEKAAGFIKMTGGRATIAGPAAAFAETVAAWAAVGVTEVIVPDFTLGTGARRIDAMDALLEAGRGVG